MDRDKEVKSFREKYAGKFEALGTGAAIGFSVGAIVAGLVGVTVGHVTGYSDAKTVFDRKVGELGVNYSNSVALLDAEFDKKLREQDVENHKKLVKELGRFQIYTLRKFSATNVIDNGTNYVVQDSYGRETAVPKLLSLEDIESR